MKKTILVLIILSLTSQLFSQKTNNVFEKKQMSVTVSPLFLIGMDNSAYGANLCFGYNIFKKTEIGISGSGLFGSKTSYYSSGIYAKYHIINRKFTPTIEFATITTTNSSDYKFNFDAPIGLGLGYYGIADKIGIELQAKYYIISKGFGPQLNLKWYF